MTRLKKRLGFLTFLVFANVLVWHMVVVSAPRGDLTVAYLNVGQGDAALIVAPNGNKMMIDGGANDIVLHELGKMLSFGDRFIDVLIATHPHLDHYGGFIDILERYGAGALFVSGAHSDFPAYDMLLTFAGERGVEVIEARAGMVIDLGGGVLAEILFPDRDVSGFDPDPSSIVTKVSYGDTAFLFTGDAPQAIENYLASIYGSALDVDVLKLGHHGSRTSTSELFLSATMPRYVIVSAGEESRHGHPHEEVIERVERHGVPYLETKYGAIVFTSDGEGIEVRQ